MLMHRALPAWGVTNLQHADALVFEDHLVVRGIDFHRVLRERGSRPDQHEQHD